jgi:hypothetical protein
LGPVSLVLIRLDPVFLGLNQLGPVSLALIRLHPVLLV